MMMDKVSGIVYEHNRVQPLVLFDFTLFFMSEVRISGDVIIKRDGSLRKTERRLQEQPRGKSIFRQVTRSISL